MGQGRWKEEGVRWGWSGEAALEFCKAMVVRHCSKILHWPRSKDSQRPKARGTRSLFSGYPRGTLGVPAYKFGVPRVPAVKLNLFFLV